MKHYEAIINDNLSDTIDPVIEIIIRTTFNDYGYPPEELQRLTIRPMLCSNDESEARLDCNSRGSIRRHPVDDAERSDG